MNVFSVLHFNFYLCWVGFLILFFMYRSLGNCIMFFWGRGKRAKRHRCKGKVQNTKWRKGYTGKSQISLLPVWITTVPVCPELKDLWEHGVFITKTGTVLSKQGQLATLSPPSFLLRGNTLTSFLSGLPKILQMFSTFIFKFEYESQSINVHLQILSHHLISLKSN